MTEDTFLLVMSAISNKMMPMKQRHYFRYGTLFIQFKRQLLISIYCKEPLKSNWFPTQQNHQQLVEVSNT